MIQASTLIEVLGWLGAATVIAAYGLVSYGSVNGRSKAYQGLNALGGLLLAVNTIWHHAWPATAVNVIWTGIALGTLLAGPARHESA